MKSKKFSVFLLVLSSLLVLVSCPTKQIIKVDTTESVSPLLPCDIKKPVLPCIVVQTNTPTPTPKVTPNNVTDINNPPVPNVSPS